MKKFSLLLVLFLTLGLFLAACGGDDADEEEGSDEEGTSEEGSGDGEEASGDWIENVTMLTGGEAGTYFPLGVAMADVISENVDGVTANGISSGASVVNINEVSGGEAQLALVQNDTAFYAHEGSMMFEEVKDGYSGVFTIYPETIQIVAMADSGIESIEDLKGKRVAVGDVGSGTEANAEQIFGVHDMTFDDISAEYMGFGDASTNLQDGNIDAAFVTSGTPTGSIQELSASADIKLVSISDDMIEALMNEYPYYSRQDIPEDAYDNFDSTGSTVAVQAMLIASDDLPEDQVYEMVKAIFENKGDIENAHERGAELTVDTAQDGMSIDLHPGAQRYYDEQ
ncbi:C4-dicarboxylate ABC transporter substrate-binding protein [Halalkalibacillus sediminis]|uniref:C4-dicarboxylate ABC transporter substrate-binding protein n=1 Tax=Halalkalibacillus sediminis TaxID=2018042 RepID=A0A2I0QQD5_9BACI|nr:TAXI family TRAP transporter solute-binding subunit [Halalkalibacillus sediminis]PKR76543.1 C4-dicarboxylate ABC transporter substrate-binding protein [Halalkalibacillus sediminis]